jgi:YggT family protein
VGGGTVIPGLLADVSSSIQRFVAVFVSVYILLVFAYILLSWIRLPYSPLVERVRRFLYDICDPYLRLFRRFVPPLGPLDLSPIVAILALVIAQRLFNALVERIL